MVVHNDGAKLVRHPKRSSGPFAFKDPLDFNAARFVDRDSPFRRICVVRVNHASGTNVLQKRHQLKSFRYYTRKQRCAARLLVQHLWAEVGNVHTCTADDPWS